MTVCWEVAVRVALGDEELVPRIWQKGAEIDGCGRKRGDAQNATAYCRVDGE
jgi:hypothetical protein